MRNWHLLTGEYPPSNGGVGHYTLQIALGLAGAGDKVHVWTPGNGAVEAIAPHLHLHLLPDRFTSRSLVKMSRELREQSGEARLIVQYVPQAFGYHGMNLGLCRWLSRRNDLDAVMFHEVAYPMTIRQPMHRSVIAVINRFMALSLGRAARRIFVAIPAWAELLRSIGLRNKPITWLPVPSNIPVANDPRAVAAVRGRYLPANGFLIGHFGTYGTMIAQALEAIISAALQNEPGVRFLLLGDGGIEFRRRLVNLHPQIADRIHATGLMASNEVSHYISACDLMVQPYPDGISTRRTSAMASLAHGRAVVTTSGHLTEPLWAQDGAVALRPVDDTAGLAEAVLSLLLDIETRRRLGDCAHRLYDERFDVRHSIAALRVDPAQRNGLTEQPSLLAADSR
jgi:glycosyltransferase involved in cell wall biosynthesis